MGGVFRLCERIASPFHLGWHIPPYFLTAIRLISDKPFSLPQIMYDCRLQVLPCPVLVKVILNPRNQRKSHLKRMGPIA